VTLRSILIASALACVLLAGGCGGSASHGDAIVFVSTRDGDYALYGMNADGSDQGRLTDERGDLTTAEGLQFQTDPAWSPDGKQIAFASAREGSFDIYVMNADGSDTRRLTTSNANEQGPTWSPDGSRIAFSRSSDGGHVWVMNAGGGGERRLTNSLAEEGEPAWSPDGRWIAYTHRASASDFREIWVAHPDGTGQRGVTRLEARSFAPAWSPDSTQLAFSANADSPKFDIYVIGADGAGLRRPVVSPTDAFEPAWSPDGDEIAFSRDGAIVVTTVAGDEQQITDPATNDSSPAWNPAPETGKEGS
jgi:Tol biopolymer transport system component